MRYFQYLNPDKLQRVKDYATSHISPNDIAFDSVGQASLPSMRKNAVWYTTEIPNGDKLARAQLIDVKTKRELEEKNVINWWSGTDDNDLRLYPIKTGGNLDSALLMSLWCSKDIEDITSGIDTWKRWLEVEANSKLIPAHIEARVENGLVRNLAAIKVTQFYDSPQRVHNDVVRLFGAANFLGRPIIVLSSDTRVNSCSGIYLPQLHKNKEVTSPIILGHRYDSSSDTNSFCSLLNVKDKNRRFIRVYLLHEKLQYMHKVWVLDDAEGVDFVLSKYLEIRMKGLVVYAKLNLTPIHEQYNVMTDLFQWCEDRLNRRINEDGPIEEFHALRIDDDSHDTGAVGVSDIDPESRVPNRESGYFSCPNEINVYTCCLVKYLPNYGTCKGDRHAVELTIVTSRRKDTENVGGHLMSEDWMLASDDLDISVECHSETWKIESRSPSTVPIEDLKQLPKRNSFILVSNNKEEVTFGCIIRIGERLLPVNIPDLSSCRSKSDKTESAENEDSGCLLVEPVIPAALKNRLNLELKKSDPLKRDYREFIEKVGYRGDPKDIEPDDVMDYWLTTPGEKTLEQLIDIFENMERHDIARVIEKHITEQTAHIAVNDSL